MKIKILNRSTLKWIALIAMLIDHIAAILGEACFANWNLNWVYTTFRIVGRLAFPIFAFFIAEGWYYTKNKKKYFFLILVFAIISQPIYYFALNSSRFSLNILITFLFSLIVLFLIDKIKANKSMAFANSILIFAVVVLVILLELLNIDVSFGLYGVALPVIFYLCYHSSFKKQILMWCVVAVLIVLNWLGNFLLLEDISINSFIELFALLAIPLLCLYNGQKGKFSYKWLFYIFYPAHILLIYLISLLI